MHIAQVRIQNFRGISDASVGFNRTSVLLGDNNSGKSSIFEALELVLGPDRLYRRPPIDEHDFHGGRYLADDNGPIEIQIEVVLVDLDDELKSRFRSNIEYWDSTNGVVLETVPQQHASHLDMCVRVRFVGAYDVDEDDFTGQTMFCSPVDDSGQPVEMFRTPDKRQIGFLHLRTLRTGTRAMSMERGSLLDVVLRSFEVELQMWERLLDRLRSIPVAGEGDDDFGAVIESLGSAMNRIVAAEWSEAPHLRVSELTREDLRHVLRAFMATGVEGHAAPFNHQGSGTVNALVIAMLSLIAERRNQRVIFAVEEPEISIPPTTQKRVVDLIRGLGGQALFTSHSPYVVEEFEPAEMLVVNRRHADGRLSCQSVELLPSLKPKAFREGIRTRFCEALLARRVIVTEGKAEALAYPYLSKLASRADPTSFGRLDTAGWAVFDAGGETNVAAFAEFFRGFGKEVATIFDLQDPDAKAIIALHSDLVIEQPHAGFEDLLVTEIPVVAKRRFLDAMIAAGEFPAHIAAPGPDDADYDRTLRKLLTRAKGEPVAIDLLSCLQIDEYPRTMVAALTQLRAFTDTRETEDKGLNAVQEDAAPSGDDGDGG